MEKDIQQKKDERVVTLLNTRSQANPWIEHTGWDYYLHRFEKAQLKDSLYPMETPNEGLSTTEIALQKACQATIKVLYQAMQICHPSIIP